MPDVGRTSSFQRLYVGDGRSDEPPHTYQSDGTVRMRSRFPPLSVVQIRTATNQFRTAAHRKDDPEEHLDQRRHLPVVSDISLQSRRNRRPPAPGMTTRD